MDEWIELADKTQVYNTYVVNLDGKIAIYINEPMGFAEMYGLFGDPKKTKRIHSYQYGDEQDWIGYTAPYAMEERDNGAVVCLNKSEEEEVNA